ncbi:hypothetical protein [Pontibacillus litoralis]|uniref:Uncharacterized protein n=1 Tax=Pontibacillus litoralis JSM 072002 TaxID=1385512 RepID=A0A0A5G365_9BACI|nr:hypothetical protein [Pontibacillus litoralis]KGX85573.1 hypothetical protein N784_08675 [Pontibacillus litoralis JSM 072002]
MGDYNHSNYFCEVLSGLPPYYPVDKVVVDGVTIEVTHFVSIDPNTGLAFFLNGGGLQQIDCKEIQAIDWT